MDSEKEKMLAEALRLARENNEILRKMKRSLMWSRIIRTVYIIIILGATFGAYYFIQPYLQGVLGAYNGLLDGTEKVREVSGQIPSGIPNLGDILNSLKNGR